MQLMLEIKEGYTIVNLPNLKNERVACLTLDLEQDYGDLLDEPSYEGLEHIPELVNFLKERDIPLTCFVQGSILKTHPTQIKQLSALDIEFELHSYSHPRPKEMDTKLEIERGKEAYRIFFGKDPVGYRSPLGVISDRDYEVLASNGFGFDSSIFPSLRPGAFNNLRKPTKPCFVNNLKIVEFPFTVFSSVIRIPIALSYIKLLGEPYLYLLRTFPLPNLIIFGFHLHDLFELSSSRKIPFQKSSFVYKSIFKRIYSRGKLNGLRLLDEFISLCLRKGYAFSKVVDIYQVVSEQEAR